MNSVSVFTIIYAVLSLIALLMMFIYKRIFKDRINRNAMVVFVAVFLIVTGYTVISFTKSLALALWMNRMVYISSVALIVEMYVIINDFSNATKNKLILNLIIAVSVLVLLLAMSGGSSITLYYRSVELYVEDNLTMLVKEYGPLHNLYALYVSAMFALMISRIIYSIVKKTVKYFVNPTVLFLLGTQNMFVWFAEKMVDTKMELLAISYIIGELMLVLIFKNEEEYSRISENKEKKKLTIEDIIENWSLKYSLTEREIDILRLLIDNISRADIAKKLYISEHTVKKHTANLYDKLCVTSRNDLLYKLNEEIIG